MPEEETSELHVDQVRRERSEREEAHDAEAAGERRAHERRADKAAYLKRKLQERGESEDQEDR